MWPPNNPRGWRSRWNYPHLIDVETVTQWGILADGERAVEDWFPSSGSGAPRCPTAPPGPRWHPSGLWGNVSPLQIKMSQVFGPQFPLLLKKKKRVEPNDPLRLQLDCLLILWFKAEERSTCMKALSSSSKHVRGPGEVAGLPFSTWEVQGERPRQHVTKSLSSPDFPRLDPVACVWPCLSLSDH